MAARMVDSGVVRTTGTTRRAVLRAGALTAVSAAGASACTIGGSSRSAPPEPTADDRVRAAVITDVQALVASYQAALAALPDLVATVGSLLAEHEAHLRALGPYPSTVPSPWAPGARPSSGEPSPAGSRPSASGSASAEPAVASSPPATTTSSSPAKASPLTLATDKLRALEVAAAPRTAAQTVRASPQLARLVASIAACESAHAAVLRERR